MDFGTWIILIVVVGFGIAVAQMVATNNNKKKLSANLSSIPDFTPTRRVLGVDGVTGLAIDQDNEKLCLLSLKATTPARIIDASNLISAELFEDGSSVTKTSRTSQFGGALVGGLALGGVGAIIGGLSGKTSTTNKVKRIELRLTVDDASKPLHDIVFMNVEGKKGGIIYSAAIAEARSWLGVMDVLIRRAEEGKRPTNSQSSTTSVADELSKLADLRTRGILSEDEFQTQKQRILGGA